MIDIIITTYNNPLDLDKSLASLVSQTNQDYKVILVDDYSSEDYSLVLKEYKDKVNIKYIKNSKNIGPGLSRQIGVDNSNSDYFIFLDSDDRLMPYSVQLIHELIEDNSKADMVICPFYNQVLEDYKKATSSKYSILLSKGSQQIITWHHGKIYNRKSIIKNNIKISEKFSRIADDWYYNVLCVELFDNIVEGNLPYYLWVQRSTSLTRTGYPKGIEKRDLLALANIEVIEDLLSRGVTPKYTLGILKEAIRQQSKGIKVVSDKVYLKLQDLLFNIERGE